MLASDAVALVKKLAAAHPRQVVSAETLAEYAEGLADLDLELAQEVVMEARATIKFFPSIAELREIAARRRSACPPSSGAWGEVMRKIGLVGRYRTPSWSHPAIAKAVDSLGWMTICDSENVEATRAHFLRLYVEVVTSVVHEVNVRPALEAQRTRDTKALGDIVKLLPGGKP